MKEKVFEKKSELLEAALSEFTARNFEEASLNNIIKNSNISKGTFYYHFQDKQALYLYLLEEAAKMKWDFVNQHTKDLQLNFDDSDIFDKFKLQARIGAEFAITHPKFHKLSMMFTKEKGNPIYDVATQSMGIGTEQLLESMIKQAMLKGEFKDTFSEEFIIKTLSYFFLHFNELFDAVEDLELDKMLQNLNSFVDFMKFGLSK